MISLYQQNLLASIDRLLQKNESQQISSSWICFPIEVKLVKKQFEQRVVLLIIKRHSHSATDRDIKTGKRAILVWNCNKSQVIGKYVDIITEGRTVEQRCQYQAGSPRPALLTLEARQLLS